MARSALVLALASLAFPALAQDDLIISTRPVDPPKAVAASAAPTTPPAPRPEDKIDWVKALSDGLGLDGDAPPPAPKLPPSPESVAEWLSGGGSTPAPAKTADAPAPARTSTANDTRCQTDKGVIACGNSQAGRDAAAKQVQELLGR